MGLSQGGNRNETNELKDLALWRNAQASNAQHPLTCCSTDMVIKVYIGPTVTPMKLVEPQNGQEGLATQMAKQAITRPPQLHLQA